MNYEEEFAEYIAPIVDEYDGISYEQLLSMEVAEND